MTLVRDARRCRVKLCNLTDSEPSPSETIVTVGLAYD